MLLGACNFWSCATYDHWYFSGYQRPATGPRAGVAMRRPPFGRAHEPATRVRCPDCGHLAARTDQRLRCAWCRCCGWVVGRARRRPARAGPPGGRLRRWRVRHRRRAALGTAGPCRGGIVSRGIEGGRSAIGWPTRRATATATPCPSASTCTAPARTQPSWTSTAIRACSRRPSAAASAVRPGRGRRRRPVLASPWRWRRPPPHAVGGVPHHAGAQARPALGAVGPDGRVDGRFRRPTGCHATTLRRGGCQRTRRVALLRRGPRSIRRGVRLGGGVAALGRPAAPARGTGGAAGARGLRRGRPFEPNITALWPQLPSTTTVAIAHGCHDATFFRWAAPAQLALVGAALAGSAARRRGDEYRGGCGFATRCGSFWSRADPRHTKGTLASALTVRRRGPANCAGVIGAASARWLA